MTPGPLTLKLTEDAKGWWHYVIRVGSVSAEGYVRGKRSDAVAEAYADIQSRLT